MEMITENSLLNYYIRNDELRHSCDFNPDLLRQGKGIYEVFRVIDGIPLFLDEHIERFFHSAELEEMRLPFDIAGLKLRLRTLIESNMLKKGNIRFQYIVSADGAGYFLAWITTAVYPTPEEFAHGVHIRTLNAARLNPHAKRANLPVRFMAEEITEKENVTEVLLIDASGQVTECHRSNIFFIRDGKLFTPPEELVLQGITREKVINLARQHQIPFAERHIPFSDIGEYDSCFISSTSKSVLPVRKIDETVFKVPDAVTSRLLEYYQAFVAKHLASFHWE